MSSFVSDADLIARYDGRVPRYTSYPTAPHFGASVNAAVYGQWLAALPEGADISLYLHVPFCDRLCLYCGCNTTVVRHERPKRAYTAQVLREMAMLVERLGRRARVSQIHWGGGTPTSLPGDCLVNIMAQIRNLFDVAADAEVAIEIDPTAVSPATMAALAEMGVTRASLGVQDFDPRVQEAIGRRQSFAQTRDCAVALRALGINSLNLDLIYGLPFQTEESVARTARQALGLQADRVAVFGYAHVPWMKKHQALIQDETLPGPEARFAQTGVIRRILVEEGGYVSVGLDHFAKPGDAMAQAALAGALHRSFQGYTTDAAPVLIGLGASSIGTLPQGYVQNETSVPAYAASIERGELPIARGVALSADDRMRRGIIEAIMCDLAADIPPELCKDTEPLWQFCKDGLVRWDGKRVVVTERGRPFVRNVAAVFDAYLQQVSAALRHAAAV
jgi:oxygen-independent coproporphyrinogen-3 oxidase